MAFATSADLVERWKPLSQAEEARATTLLGDAAWWMKVWFKEFGDLVVLAAADPELAEGLEILSCSMVKRAMTSAGDGVGQAQQVMGPFTAQISYRNPDGNLYIYTAEREAILSLLGVNTSGAVSMESPGL
ncbi:Gp19/Gp15/Gp42 family protein [Nocardia salmonicida]|uniref:Gp19/Gp15/Gp42 family protein n=1 Tax=Nocardia salmonicida TaxID=53431 RepID=UPI00343AE160